MKRYSLLALSFSLLFLSACQKDVVESEPFPSTSDFRFSVSETQKVRLASGNLQYRPFDKQWRMAPNQYDIIGDSNLRRSDSYQGWVDLFEWDDDGWQTGMGNEWRVLSDVEWDYLLTKRPKASSLRAKGTVHRVKGFILLPDGWQCPPTVFFTPNPVSDETEYTTSDWKKMEEAGAVFLPAGGRMSGVSLANVGEQGYYWTSAADEGENAVSLHFVDYSINPYYVYPKRCGLSIRLAKNE